MKEIHTRIKSKQTKVVQYAQGKSAILRIFSRNGQKQSENDSVLGERSERSEGPSARA